MTAYDRNHAAGPVQSAGSPEFAITKNDNGAVDVTLGSLSMPYASSNLHECFTWDKSDGTNSISINTMSSSTGAEDTINGKNTASAYHQVWGYF